MPFDVKARAEALPISGKQIVTLPGVRRCGKREIDGLVAAAEALECEDLTIVTHDEESAIKERGHDIRVVPAWKWCLDAKGKLGDCLHLIW